MSSAIDWSRFRNVLCIRPDNLGDVLMTTPAIRALKRAVDGRRITLLTSSAAASLAECIPEIDECIDFDPPWYKHDRQARITDVTGTVAKLRSRHFDAAVIFTVFSQSPLPNAMLCYLAGIPRIAGWCRENPYALITDWLPDEEPFHGMSHEVDRQLALARRLGGVPDQRPRLSLTVPEPARRRIATVLARHGIGDGDKWLVLHPGASEAKRCYPPDRYAEAVRRLNGELGYRVLLTGSDQERVLAESIAATGGEAISLAGELRLDELAALIEMAPLLISNNTGPVHIAAAVGTPVVVLYALTNPQHAPWGIPHRVLPFDVPEDLRSRNVLVRLGADHAFREPAGMVEPWQIVQAARDLLELPNDAPFARTPLVMTRPGGPVRRERVAAVRRPS